MAITGQRIVVSTAAVPLNTASPGGQNLVIRNTDATNGADLGTSAVTAGAGFPLGAATTVTVQVDPGDVLYAIRSAAADVSLAVLVT